MKNLNFTPYRPDAFSAVSQENWLDWRWQMRAALKSKTDFEAIFALSEGEKAGFELGQKLFKFSVTPYYASLAHPSDEYDPIRRIFMPREEETRSFYQQMLDPLGENKNQPVPRIVHRYSDRVLFWATDICGVYCRYCTRKHFTAKGHAVPDESEYSGALEYIKSRKGIREVILSGGDPLTLSDEALERILTDLRKIDHVEIIRLGTRMPVVNPMRITDGLVRVLRSANPVFIMTHFNHPREITDLSSQALQRLVDAGLPTFNQMVLLNGVNNHAAIVQALSRRLMLNRVKPYYMFQCDPSEGTDHLRTSIENSEQIQKELWGHLSGLAMPNLSIDIPNGGGKAAVVPQFEKSRTANRHWFEGWDGVEAEYISPRSSDIKIPSDIELYIGEWNELKASRGERI